jgi:adenine/guanine/hypoxanthine permease
MLFEAGMDFGSVFVATCLASAVGSMLMGILTNYPIALAPGMGLNAFFSFGIVLGAGNSWQVALGAVFISGSIFFLLSFFGLRQIVMDAIPTSIRTGIFVGIGLFLAFIGLQNAHIVVDDPNTLVGMGDISQPSVMLSIFGLCIISALSALKKPWAIPLAIGLTSLFGILFLGSKFEGVFSAPPDFGKTFLQLNVIGAVSLKMVPTILALVFILIFDTTGTLFAVGKEAGLLDENGQLPNSKQAMIADSGATVLGSLFGTSTTTSYIESAAGVAVGGKTGLTSVTVGVLFLVALFFSPLVKSIPAYATAPALIFIAALMIRHLKEEFNWDDYTESVPMVLTAISMPLLFSIADAIALGVIVFVITKIISGRWKDMKVATYILALIFAASLTYLNI